MHTIHEKSSCCRGKIRRFGNRRRQCVTCLKTWSVWKRKRGRKSKRIHLKFVKDYLEKGHSLLKINAKRNNVKVPAIRARLRNTLVCFNKRTKWLSIPEGNLIVIADAMIQNINHKNYSIYFILLKGVETNKAIIIPPFIKEGGEGYLSWSLAFSKISKETLERVVALVSDGRSGLISIAKRKGWINQRCHFHLRYRIANYARTGILARNNIAGRIKMLVDVTLTSHNKNTVHEALNKLIILKPEISSKGLKTVISGFIKKFDDYRTYLDYPDLNLPTTSNSIESLISSVRELLYEAKGFRSIKSLNEWIIALLKHKRFITCNGCNYQQN